MADDTIDWTGVSRSWHDKHHGGEQPSVKPERFAAEQGSELACARAELYDAVQDILDLGYLEKSHWKPFFARRLKLPIGHIDLKLFDLETCERALVHAYAFLDRKIAVDNLLPPADENSNATKEN